MGQLSGQLHNGPHTLKPLTETDRLKRHPGRWCSEAVQHAFDPTKREKRWCAATAEVGDA